MRQSAIQRTETLPNIKTIKTIKTIEKKERVWEIHLPGFCLSSFAFRPLPFILCLSSFAFQRALQTSFFRAFCEKSAARRRRTTAVEADLVTRALTPTGTVRAAEGIESGGGCMGRDSLLLSKLSGRSEKPTGAIENDSSLRLSQAPFLARVFFRFSKNEKRKNTKAAR
ncbi:MAG: hypothetical protein HQL99_05250, partial [Magnetococcales bacterium]|nr:hypothetical protein [Magnetococcales bacterium]